MTAAPRFRPEDFKPSRRLPAPGEEAANDARMNARLEEVGVYDDRRAVETFRDGMERARVARPREFLERRIAEIETNPTRQNGNSRLVGALKSAGYGALQGFARTGNLAGAAGGAITGGTIGAVDDTADERLSEQRQVEIMRAGLQQMYGREAAGLKLDDARAGVRLKNEQADYYGQKPEAEAAKREAQRVKDERARIFRVLGALKGQQLDPNDERVQQLQRDADRADIPFDVGSFNNSKGNLVRYTRTDPEHPERTVEVERNVVTGEESVLGQRGFQPTRDAQGNTTSQNASIEDRRKLLGLRARNIELEIQNKERELSTGIPASASRAFSTATAGLSAQLAQKRQQIAALRKSALELTADPVEAEARADALEVEANEILERMEAVRAQTLGGGSSSAVARASGRFSGKKTPRSRLPEFARRWGVSEAEAEQRIKDEGGTVY
jgi:hypothetical protein